MSNPTSSLVGAARARSLSSLTDVTAAERRILGDADPAQETPAAPVAPISSSTSRSTSNALDALAAGKKRPVKLTPLYCQIPITLDQALARAMDEKGLQKTEIVVAALRSVLAEYL